MLKDKKCFPIKLDAMHVFVMKISTIQPLSIVQIVKKSNVTLKSMPQTVWWPAVFPFIMGKNMENSIVAQLIGGVVSILKMEIFWEPYPSVFDIQHDRFFSSFFILADPKDEIIPVETAIQQNTVDDTQMTCKFGSLVLKVGEKIKTEKFCVECSCSKPPMMHCVQNGHCWSTEKTPITTIN